MKIWRYLLGLMLLCLNVSAVACESNETNQQANALIEQAFEPNTPPYRQLSLNKQALALDPDNTRALYNAAVLSTKTAPEEAIAYYEKLLSLCTDDYQARVNIIHLYTNSEQANNAYHIRWHIKQLKHFVAKEQNKNKRHLIQNNDFDKLLSKATRLIETRAVGNLSEKIFRATEIDSVLKSSLVDGQTRGSSGFEGKRDELKIKFMMSSFTLTKRAKKQLDEFIRAFSSGLLAQETFVFRGYVGEQEASTPEQKEALGLNRAVAAKAYVVNHSEFEPQRIKTESGSDRFSHPNPKNGSIGWDARVGIYYAQNGNSPVWSTLN